MEQNDRMAAICDWILERKNEPLDSVLKGENVEKQMNSLKKNRISDNYRDSRDYFFKTTSKPSNSKWFHYLMTFIGSELQHFSKDTLNPAPNDKKLVMYMTAWMRVYYLCTSDTFEEVRKNVEEGWWRMNPYDPRTAQGQGRF